MLKSLPNRVVKAGRTLRINWLLRSGQVRLVSSATATRASRSIHSEQPLNPNARWNAARSGSGRGVLRRRVPAQRAGTALRPLTLGEQFDGLRLKRFAPLPERFSRVDAENRGRQSAAGPERWKKAPHGLRRHRAPRRSHPALRPEFGGGDRWCLLRSAEWPPAAGRGQYPVDFMPSGGKISRGGEAMVLPGHLQCLPSRMKPRSEYSARVPGLRLKGSSRQALKSSEGSAVVRKNST